MADLQESLERNEELKIMRIHTKYFFTSVKMKTQKNGKNDPIFGKTMSIRLLRMSYGGLTVVLRFYTDYSNVKIQIRNEI